MSFVIIPLKPKYRTQSRGVPALHKHASSLWPLALCAVLCTLLWYSFIVSRI
jgi:hypothetical protein